MRRGVADRVEPPTASGGVHPPLRPLALRVLPHEQEVGPLLVGERLRVGGIRDVGLAAVAELDLVAGAAPGTTDRQHQAAPASNAATMRLGAVKRQASVSRSSTSPRSAFETTAPIQPFGPTYGGTK